MRGLALFVAGTLVGIAATSMGQSQGPNRGVVGINHVALAVPDIDKAVEHYTRVMGFPEAFRVRTPQGEVQLVYIQVSKDTFIELQTINAQRPAGIYHFGVVVEDMHYLYLGIRLPSVTKITDDQQIRERKPECWRETWPGKSERAARLSRF